MNITQPPILPSGEPTTPATDDHLGGGAAVLPSPRHRWWATTLLVLSFVTLTVIAVLGVVPAQTRATKVTRDGETEATPFALTPAAAQPVDDRISFGELGNLATQYPPDGNIYFVTVSEPPQSLLSWLIGRKNPAVQFITYEEKYGVQTPTQSRTLSLASMQSAEQIAEYVALSKLRFKDVKQVPGEVLINTFVCLEYNQAQECVLFAPSEKVLEPGDEVVAIDGANVDTIEDLAAQLSGQQPGDTVELVVDRPGVGERTFDIELVESPQTPGRAIIGFVPFDTTRVEIPFDLNIETGQIGGPSAGLAFTLTLIDELSPGELTGGQSIAVTGTINRDGDVGPIGGLAQKASAVDQAGVGVFIVPVAQGEDDIRAAQKAAPSLKIVPVATLDDALATLQELGGDPLPSS